MPLTPDRTPSLHAFEKAAWTYGLPLFLVGFMLLSSAAHRMGAYLLGVGVLIEMIRHKWWPAHTDRPFLVLLLLFLAYAYASAGWSNGASVHLFLSQSRPLLLLLLFFSALCFIAEKFGRGMLERQLAWGCWLMLGAGGIIAPLWWLIEGMPSGRLGGLGGASNPILFSATLAIALIGTLSYRHHLERLPGWLYWGVIAAGMIAFSLAESRGPFLGLLAVACLMLLWHAGRPVRLAVAGLGLAAGVLAFGAIMANGLLLDFLLSIDKARVIIWQDTVAAIGQAPVFGHGVEPRVRFGTQITREGFSSPHSIYLGTFFHLGVIGMGLAFMLWGRAFFLAATRLPEGASRIFVICLFVFGAVHGAVEFAELYMNVGTEWLVFWLAPLLAAALVRGASLPGPAPSDGADLSHS